MKDDLEFSSQDTFEDGGAVGVDPAGHIFPGQLRRAMCLYNGLDSFEGLFMLIRLTCSAQPPSKAGKVGQVMTFPFYR